MTTSNLEIDELEIYYGTNGTFTGSGNALGTDDDLVTDGSEILTWRGITWTATQNGRNIDVEVDTSGFTPGATWTNTGANAIPTTWIVKIERADHQDFELDLMTLFTGDGEINLANVTALLAAQTLADLNGTAASAPFTAIAAWQTANAVNVNTTFALIDALISADGNSVTNGLDAADLNVLRVALTAGTGELNRDALAALITAMNGKSNFDWASTPTYANAIAVHNAIAGLNAAIADYNAGMTA
jgi:hypothetical protein